MFLEDRFRNFVQEKKLYSPEDTLLLAVSGGLDSMTLLHLLRRTHDKLFVAHCNFKLRGAESDGDAAFVRSVAEKLGITYEEKTFETSEYAQEQGMSVQMAARALRYAWFEELCVAHQLDKIATAHHLDDHVETAWLHFIRGTGLKGLAGMPLQNGRAVRPLLFASRTEIEAYAIENKVQWREDSSNQEDYYARNFIRNQLIPGAKSMNPAFLETSSRSLNRIRESIDNLEHLLGLFLVPESDLSGALRWSKAKLEQLPGRRQALSYILQSYGFDDEQVRQIAEGFEDVGKQWSGAEGHRLVMDRTHLIIETAQAPADTSQQIDKDDLMVRLHSGDTLFKLQGGTGRPMPDGKFEILVPEEKLIFPLMVRNWVPGDVFQPFGMAGRHQKIKSYLTNSKVPRTEKDRTLLLINGDGKVIWLIGHRLDERFAVQPEDEALVRFRVEA